MMKIVRLVNTPVSNNDWQYHNKCIYMYIYATLVTRKLNINYTQMLIPGNSEIGILSLSEYHKQIYCYSVRDVCIIQSI